MYVYTNLYMYLKISELWQFF